MFGDSLEAECERNVQALNALLEAMRSPKRVSVGEASNGLGLSYQIEGRMPGEKKARQLPFAYVWTRYPLEKLIAEMCFAGDVDLSEIRKVQDHPNE